MLAAALKVLAHPKRLRFLRFVTEPRALEDIATHLKVARQSAQEHLDQLIALGLVEPRLGRGDHGPVTLYVLVVARLFDIYDRLGVRLGVLDAELDESVHLRIATSPLHVGQSFAPANAPVPRLTIMHGMRVGQTIPLQGTGPWLIGRDPSASLCLDYDSYVSNRHAEVRRGPNGFELADAFSSNGVWVDWRKVERGSISPLANGTVVRVGKTILLFRTT
jgi:DNA-binding transcriptional ArsR family regulator